MNAELLLPVAYLADQAAGDPEWFPHPVRLMGTAITRGEALLRRPKQSDREELLAGAMLTAAVVGSSYLLTRLALAAAYRCSKQLGVLAEIGLGWTCLAARNLHDEASQVLAALDASDLSYARTRLARIVGRDTAQLDACEISRAVIETVAESASDGVMAPLFYMALGGVPLAMAYKAVNTLDSMIGHADERYFYFGKAAARLDDVANFLPARMTALAVIGASRLRKADAEGAWRIWLRDGHRHKSPNAGQPESAMAGALGVRLGGGNFYAGEFIAAEPMGGEFRAPGPQDARAAVRIVSAAALLGLGAAVLLGFALRPRRTRG
ncbi:adenosylcobinamide-phosphate synthase CbiB [Silvibacterium sp.]|uniref:adenosylcobinamide-phosphate synthase CbiB n=1 Tax=Silvibacterium sp. TaxID=1964179 RepID=UPI0039E51946